MVAFTPRAHLRCLKTWGHEEIVINWDEFKACGEHVAGLKDPVDQAKAMVEALLFFCDRQQLSKDRILT